MFVFYLIHANTYISVSCNISISQSNRIEELFSVCPLNPETIDPRPFRDVRATLATWQTRKKSGILGKISKLPNSRIYFAKKS